MRVLIVEDGFEYGTSLARFLPTFTFTRAGSGPEALALLASAAFDAVFLDMRFDRATELLGDPGELVARFNGDGVRARRHLEDHQGTYILAALRAAGHGLPVLLSYDFGDEPRRFERLAARHAPLAWVGDTASPEEIARKLRG